MGRPYSLVRPRRRVALQQSVRSHYRAAVYHQILEGRSPWRPPQCQLVRHRAPRPRRRVALHHMRAKGVRP